MEKIPAGDEEQKEMAAFRFSRKEKKMLEDCAEASKRTQTDLLRWLIQQYHKEHIDKKIADAKAKAGKGRR